MKEIDNTANECIQVEEVKRALQQNEKIQIIDVRSKEEFENYHIPEAINIALSEIENQINQIKKDHKIIIACGKGGGRSMDGAKLLKKMGYNANWLCGGTNEWLNLK
ncbi:rhodanese-like domain-containing protein [Flavobacterium gawalongense]|uniref:Rhodanese-like domain-containing protein n=1 Tax=Flavobacterium gawalongense TaxID=2594432 RepID=A0A553B9E4_9FLAO|nr:rhodanese-like domain-containing protein [Flavobacterium gawalongense]TRW98570.1 rhodanese-like domain-containing protein [Flavobacterium gawalongense]TRX03091.1 rhodanese-like domain-containing protein [Flavobacterium gawalongense]TRX04853.1 rhodanese-like domain-containing protein [Flavobacterium gawalongense]TRX05436.1 rhodanese-like domain-containing protein [Flavobacterium gawalongense]TRX24850.1 rhodanese-like domain-containing protein [Flavobacterium gawalongense]